jgi:L-asparagine transporter-like permease
VTSDSGSAFRRHPSVEREQVLSRDLGARQQAMLAIGGAIGTGLFLGSGLSVTSAGPAVVVSYLLMAGLSFLLAAALTEMCVAHPTAGSFGVYAEMYLSPFTGYVVRISYWLMQLVATGGHMIATAVYMRYWFPEVPGFIWIAGFSALLVYLNSRAVKSYAELEYWLVMVKVLAVVAFIVLGVGLIAGIGGRPALGLHNYTAYGGLFPTGIGGLWIACCFVLYSFIGVEVVAVTSGEARDPERTIPRAMNRMVWGLSAVYIVTVLVLVGVIPWNRIGVSESPFVTVLSGSGIARAAGVMNFVVLTAALSAANANLYLVARTLFSLARSGFVPASIGKVNESGTPVNALLISMLGLLVAMLVQWQWPESAYVWFLGVALFGALLVWLLVFVTHVRFRAAWAAAGVPLVYRSPVGAWGSRVGAVALVAVLATTWRAPGLKVTLISAGPWLAIVALGYAVSSRTAAARRLDEASKEEMAPRAMDA